MGENKLASSKYKVSFKEDNHGTIITPFFFDVLGHEKQVLEINFNELSKGTFSFSKYGLIQFIIKKDSVKNAVKLAKNRLNNILYNGYPKRSDIFVVSGFRYDENNEKKPYELSFMENTHLLNQFTARSYKIKQGDLLKHDCDGDGWGFWYVVDKDGKRISERLKGGIFLGYLSDGVIKKY